MLVGFSVGTIFFLSQRLFASRVPPPEHKEPEEVATEEDDEAWMAAHGLSAADLPTGGTQDGEVISAKAAILEKELGAMVAVDEVKPMVEPGPEPAPEPTPVHAERVAQGTEAPAGLLAQAPPPQPPRLARQTSAFPWQQLLALVAAFAAIAALNTPWHSPPAEQPTLPVKHPVQVEEQGSNATKPITLTLTRQNTPTTVIDGVIYHRSAYWGTLFVGSPPVPFTVVFDTGSGHVILPSTYCHSEVCRARKRYRAKSSSTHKSINHDGSEVHPYEMRDQITVSFGTGEVSGVFMEDRLCVTRPDWEDEKQGPSAVQQGDGTSLPPGCMSMRMIAATAMSEDPFEEFSFDGVLGLGLPGLSEGPAFNFLSVAADAMGDQAKRFAHTFALFLSNGNNEDDESEITLGGYNDERLDGDLAWNRVVEPQLGQWMVEVKSLRVGDERISFCKQGCRAIMDTGTSMLAAPSGVIAELLELLEHPSSSGVDCRGPGPQLHFDMDGITVTLGPEDYSHLDEAEEQYEPLEYAMANGTSSGPRSAAQPMCKAMVMAMDLPEPVGPKLFILGEPVLRKYYTVYDAQAPPRVGLGLVRQSRRAREERRKQLGLRS